MPRTENGKQNSKRTEAFKALNTRFGFSEYVRKPHRRQRLSALHAYATLIRQSWIGNHIDSATAQKLATRAFKAVQRIAFGQAKKVRFKGKNQLLSVEGKSNDSGIRYRGESGWRFTKKTAELTGIYGFAENPSAFNGTIKPGKKTWYESTRYKKTRRKLAELQRKLAAHRKTLHGKKANRILRQGKHVKTEKLNYRAFQKNYGRSVRDRAPGKFMEILRR